jgi:hypothetical protein
MMTTCEDKPRPSVMASVSRTPPVQYPPWAVRQRRVGGGDGRNDTAAGGRGAGATSGGKGKGGTKGKVEGRGKGKKGGGSGKGKGHFGGKGVGDPRVGAQYRDEFGGVYVEGGYIYNGVFRPCA